MAAKRVFISYSRKDADSVQELVSQMNSAAYATQQIEPWFDKDQDAGIEGGEE